MKKRTGFVSNSSSSSFIITNKTNNDLTLVDFVRENPDIIEDFVCEYSWYKNEEYNQEALLESANNHNEVIPAHSSDEFIFGDEDGTLIGRVFDYALRNGGTSDSFDWGFHDSYR